MCFHFSTCLTNHLHSQWILTYIDVYKDLIKVWHQTLNFGSVTTLRCLNGFLFAQHSWEYWRMLVERYREGLVHVIHWRLVRSAANKGTNIFQRTLCVKCDIKMIQVWLLVVRNVKQHTTGERFAVPERSSESSCSIWVSKRKRNRLLNQRQPSLALT